VRLAIGAGRPRLVRQFVIERFLLESAGGVVGVLLALSATSLLRRAADALPLNATFEVRLDLRVMLFALAASAVAGVVFGLVPAVVTARKDPVATLKDEGVASGREGSLLRAGLVAGQVAICVVLLICASLLVRSLRNAVETGLGFDPSGVLLVPLTAPDGASSPENGRIFYSGVLERIGALPRVEGLALGSQVPLGGAYSRRVFMPDGHQPAPGEDMELDFAIVSPGYLELMRIPIVRGRPLDESDGAGSVRTAVVNQAFVDRFWSGQNAVGRHIRRGSSPDAEPLEIVGVTATGKLRALDETPRPNVYLPLDQNFTGNVTLHARSSGDPLAILPSVRSALREVDPDLAIAGARSLESAIAGQVLPLQMAGTLFTGFGLIALAVAMIGLYGILAYSVGQRTKEIGIRIALGASGRRLAATIVRRALALVLVGAGIGLLGGLLAARPLEGLLFGVSGTDPATVAVVIGLLTGVSFVAIILPARRATRVDPMVAIRES
jgi:putative ABC transport system permease protein